PSRIYPSLQIYLSAQIYLYPLTNCCRHALMTRPSRERKGPPMRLPKPSPFLRLSREPSRSHSAYSLGSPKQNRARSRLLHNKVTSKVHILQLKSENRHLPIAHLSRGVWPLVNSRQTVRFLTFRNALVWQFQRGFYCAKSPIGQLFCFAIPG